MNDMQQESIQQMPFFANFGWHPRSAVDVLLPVDMPTGSGTSAFPLIKQQRQIIQIVRDCMTYRVGLRAQANFSARTFKPAREANAGQRAALSVQLSQLQLRCGTSISCLQASSPCSELSAERAMKNVIAFWRVGRNLSSILTWLATSKARTVNLSRNRRKKKQTARSICEERSRPPPSIDRQSPQPRSLQVSFQICRVWFFKFVAS